MSEWKEVKEEEGKLRFFVKGDEVLVEIIMDGGLFDEIKVKLDEAIERGWITKAEIEEVKGVKVKPETKVPEGVNLVRFEFENEKYAEMAELMFSALMKGYMPKSAVNLDTMVRLVLVEKGKKSGEIVKVYMVDKENAVMLRQLLDWIWFGFAMIVAVKREGRFLEVAYIKHGLQPPPPTEKYIYYFKKTDGWTLVREEK